jgi:hypothetical protein
MIAASNADLLRHPKVRPPFRSPLQQLFSVGFDQVGAGQAGHLSSLLFWNSAK